MVSPFSATLDACAAAACSLGHIEENDRQDLIAYLWRRGCLGCIDDIEPALEAGEAKDDESARRATGARRAAGIIIDIGHPLKQEK